MAEKDNRLVGVKEIARRANVSIGTVDRVIHGRKGVSEQTKKQVIAVIKELRYQPNIFARQLASKKQLRLAVLIPEVSAETDYWSAPLLGIRQAAEEVSPYGIAIEYFLFDLNDKASFLRHVSLIDLSLTDGVLLAPVFTRECISLLFELDQRKIPYVFINSDIPGQQNLSYIGPDLYQSGYLSGHLMKYLVGIKDTILIVNVSQQLDDEHHLLRKEEGFRNYFEVHRPENSLLRLDISKTDFPNLSTALEEVLQASEVSAIYVTNSRVSLVARHLVQSGRTNTLLIGFDYTADNLYLLKQGVIDFLICQQPREQGYKGIITLYQYLVHSMAAEKVSFMPIEIITRENCDAYRN